MKKNPIIPVHTPKNRRLMPPKKTGWREESISVYLKMFSFLMMVIFILLPIVSD
jgi:hypothetical protein